MLHHGMTSIQKGNSVIHIGEPTGLIRFGPDTSGRARPWFTEEALAI
jgi:hypothetical protein